MKNSGENFVFAVFSKEIPSDILSSKKISIKNLNKIQNIIVTK
jgi:hypothetical protein